MRPLRKLCEDEYHVVEPQINAEGVHVWPFDDSFPVDVRFLMSRPRHHVRTNRHDFFEMVYLCAGQTEIQVQDRSLPFREGDLAVIGSTLYHNVGPRSAQPLMLAVLFFRPDLIRADGGPDSAEYLTPFLLQDAQFPHVIAAKTGIPAQIFSLMQRIRAELPAESARARLTVKTYLKMCLILLVNQYASYEGTVLTYQRQQRALERLKPLFEYLERHYAEPVHIQHAARLCAMSQSHFMSFFKRVTGQSFMAYLNHCRIERAQALLASVERPISEIGQQIGFCDQSYFGAVFRRLVGMTPAAYRRQVRGATPGRSPR